MSLRTSSLIAALALSLPAWVHAGEVPQPASLTPRLVGSWQCVTNDPEFAGGRALFAFTFSLGRTAKVRVGGSNQVHGAGQGSWERTGAGTFRSEQQVLTPFGRIGSLDAALTHSPTGPLQLQARLALDPLGSAPALQLDFVGTCARIELDAPASAPAGSGRPDRAPFLGFVVGSWSCTGGSTPFGATFELGRTFLATPGLTGHGTWGRTGRSTFVSRDVTPFLPGAFLLSESTYELDRMGALAFERTSFLLDPTTGMRIPIFDLAGSCQRIEVAAR